VLFKIIPHPAADKAVGLRVTQGGRADFSAAPIELAVDGVVEKFFGFRHGNSHRTTPG
jgi:hypothetical protein